MLRTIRAAVWTRPPSSDPKLFSTDDDDDDEKKRMTLKVFFTETRTDALESSTVDCEAREEAFWTSDLLSRPACDARVRELLRGLLPPSSPSHAFFSNLLAGIACAGTWSSSGFRMIASVEARFDVDTYTPPRPKACMLCLEEYALGDAVVRHPRCEHHFHRRCSEYYCDQNDVGCVVCSHSIEVIERIHASVDGQEFEVEIAKFA